MSTSVSPYGQCDTYIHDHCIISTFCLNIKIIVWPWICVLARSSLLSDIGIRNLAHCCITIRHHVVHVVHDLCLTFIFDLCVGCRGFTHNFYLVSINELSVAMAVAKVSLVNGTNFPLISSSQELFGQSLPNLVCSICRVRRQEISNFMTPTPREGNF